MQRVRVVAGLLERPGSAGPLYLIQQRRHLGPRPLLWEFPGGKVEPGEDDAHALVRELREELDCVVEVGEQVDARVHRYPDLELELLLYRCTLLEGEPAPLSAAAIEWAPVSRLGSFAFTEADVPFVNRLVANSGKQP